jgi:hypothetical protein
LRSCPSLKQRDRSEFHSSCCTPVDNSIYLLPASPLLGSPLRPISPLAGLLTSFLYPGPLEHIERTLAIVRFPCTSVVVQIGEWPMYTHYSTSSDFEPKEKFGLPIRMLLSTLLCQPVVSGMTCGCNITFSLLSKGLTVRVAHGVLTACR